VSDGDKRDERASGVTHGRRGFGDESGIIVFGGGGRGCAGRGCLFWIVVSIVLSVSLTILVNLILILFSGPGTGVNV
jgi:hypothetical protein